MSNQELIRNTNASVSTSPVVLAEEQYGTQRSVLLITNTSTGGQNITISPGDEAVAGKGIVISPGGYYLDSLDQGYRPTNARITAISSAAGGTVSIHERVIMRVV